MDERMNRMAQQLGRNPAALRALMQSRDGQALMRMLTQQDQGASLQRQCSPPPGAIPPRWRRWCKS